LTRSELSSSPTRRDDHDGRKLRAGRLQGRRRTGHHYHCDAQRAFWRACRRWRQSVHCGTQRITASAVSTPPALSRLPRASARRASAVMVGQREALTSGHRSVFVDRQGALDPGPR
jgi:hypothetical protein